MKTSAWLLLVWGVSLSGCASYLVEMHAEQEGAEVERYYQRALSDQPRVSPRHLLCPMVCDGQTPTYLLAGAEIPLYLVFPATVDSLRVLLTEQRPDCPTPSVPAPDLDLVVVANPLPFQPTASGDRPTLAMLNLDFPKPESGGHQYVVEYSPEDRWRVELVGTRATVLYKRSGQVGEGFLFQDTKQFAHGKGVWAAHRNRLLYLASLPVDVVTSPIQLGVAVVFGVLFLVVGLGSDNLRI